MTAFLFMYILTISNYAITILCMFLSELVHHVTGSNNIHITYSRLCGNIRANSFPASQYIYPNPLLSGNISHPNNRRHIYRGGTLAPQ